MSKKKTDTQPETPLAFRVEYEIPPMRAIYSSWFEEHPGRTTAELAAMFETENPGYRVRKIDRHQSVSGESST